MKTIYLVISDCGDGSQSIEWHKTMSDEKYEKMEQQDRYQSGDGVQITELKLPSVLDLDTLAKINHITWFDDEEFLLED